MDTYNFKAQQPANPPVVMLGDHVTQKGTELTIHCHDRFFNKVTAVDGTGQEVFRVEGMTWGTSWSLRRRAWAEPGHKHAFDLRHESISIKNGWLVEAPGDGQKICKLVHNSYLTKMHSDINATVRTKAGEEVLVTMRQRDLAATSVTVSVGDETLATIDKFEYNERLFQCERDRSVWKAHVRPGVDLSLVISPPPPPRAVSRSFYVMAL